MIQLKVAIILNLFFLQTVSSQINSFEINGIISGTKSGKIYLITPEIDKKYYGSEVILYDSSEIINGKFSFARRSNNAMISPFRFYIESKNLSGETGLIFLESKNQSVIIDTIDSYIPPQIINSKFQKELREEYDIYFKSIIEQGVFLDNYAEDLYEKYGNNIPAEIEKAYFKKCENLIKKGDSVLLNYAITHKESYITLWKLIERFGNFDYKNGYLDIYNLLSPSMKSTQVAKLLFSDFQTAKRLSPGSKFPNVNLLDTLLDKKSLSMKSLEGKYTLIDFWFSKCMPCLKQFPKYRRLYEIYNLSGFNIIGISVDKYSDISFWKKTIQNEGIMWDQFIDSEGVANKYFIKSFPTNFLIDQTGTILKRNISISDLEDFLGKRLMGIIPYNKLLFEPD